MSDVHKTLLLTRPANSSAAFLANIESVLKRRVPVVMSPVIDIVDIGEVPDVDAYDILIVTSQHAVRRLGQVGALSGKSVACVGAATAVLAKSFGAKATSLGASVEEFLRNADHLDGSCLYCRGQHVSHDLKGELVTLGFVVEEAVVYDQRARPLTTVARRILAGSDPVVLPLFSRRSADILQSGQAFTAPLSIVAISQSVADCWALGGKIRIAREPNAAAMVEAVIAEI